jgi:ubiquinone/menaquinone biosynthesis C-methylase UbiE
MDAVALDAPAQAFDAIAPAFDARYGAWESVAAQRRAVRATLLRVFPPGARLLEVGGGTGEDALWLTQQGRSVLLTDPSPAMVQIAGAKLRGSGAPAPRVLAAEQLDAFASELAEQGVLFDGAFSNFAGLNCVRDLRTTARGLSRLVRSGGNVALVIFGTASPGEVLVQVLRGRPDVALRRRSRSDVHARLGGREFTVRYHRRSDVINAMQPWFRYVSRQGIGVFVPPSAAEPWITGHRTLLRTLERLDEIVSQPLAALGDHVLYLFERTASRTNGAP